MNSLRSEATVMVILGALAGCNPAMPSSTTGEDFAQSATEDGGGGGTSYTAAVVTAFVKAEMCIRDSAASVRLHITGMSRATVQGFGVLQGLFGSRNTAPIRGGVGLSVHFAWDNGTSLSGGYLHGRGEGVSPSAIYLGGPDYHIGRETSQQSYSRPPIPNRESVPSPWPWLWERLKSEWNEAEAANEAHRRGEDWLTEELSLIHI